LIQHGKAALCVALALVVVSGACTNSHSGGGPGARRTILLSTEYDDLAAGDDAAKQIEAEMGLYKSPALTAYVSEVGRRLVAYAPLRPFQYTFQVVDQMAPNAFSLPGGHIYVSRGLVALANSEDELAGVLGHEIIHAAERHAAAQQEMARRTSPLLMPYIRIARLASYSRDHERAADMGGQEIAAKAGYDPAALAEFLKHLGDTERLLLGYSRLTTYFDTHPGTTERVASTASRAMTLDWTPDPTRQTGRTPYLRRIEGIVLDTDPAEGIFRETEFIHPDLDFRVLFPRGWQLVNTHQAVGAVSPEGRARIFITLEPPLLPPGMRDGRHRRGSPAAGENPTQESADEPATPPQMPTAVEAADRFASNVGDEFRVSVKRRGPVQIGDIEAYRVDFDGSMGNAAVGGQATFIPHGGMVFRLMSVATASSWDQYVGRAHTTARTFRSLTEEERASVKVLHLRLARAVEGEDVASLSSRTRNQWHAGQTAVLNGIFVDDRFEEGELVKIARAVRYTPRDPEARAAEREGDAGPDETEAATDPETELPD
jgi:predicted Zn-dependent protease